MRIVWASDIHLDFVSDEEVDAFGRALFETGAELTIVTGDIAAADSFVAKLGRLARAARMPIDFVLGNHDFYGGAIDEVRARAATAGGALTYLPVAPARPIGDRAWLVGVDGWGDARLGAPQTTPVVLNDFFSIDDLVRAGANLLETLRVLGDREATLLRYELARVDADAIKIVVATHVPPFAGACWHEGAISSDDWLPFFTCDAVGRVLTEAAASRPHTDFTVLCGHTHGEGYVRIATNLEVFTAGASYGAPALARVLDT